MICHNLEVPTAQPPKFDLRVVPWTDPVLATIGHDPRSRYVEAFWLPTLGPTCVILLRHLADRFDDQPDGFILDSATTSTRLGLGVRANAGAPLRRAIERLATFDFAGQLEPGTIAIRRHLPPIHTRHVRRLPEPVRIDHDDWVATERTRPPHEAIRRRARAQALLYFEQGAERDLVERWLEHTGYPPRVARDASVWAWQRHREALTASNPPPPSAA